MLTESAASNISGKSVTTLIRSIGLFHGHEMVPPRLHCRPRRHPLEAEQPLPVVGAASRDHERSRHDPALLVHYEQPGFGGEHRQRDRKSTRLNSSHLVISYAVFCLK